MKHRNVKLACFKMYVENNGFDKSFVMKRNVSTNEARHILRDLLGIVINKSTDFDDNEDYIDYNNQLTLDVNLWLDGKCGDSTIMEYAYDCSEESIGIWNAFKIAEYLQKKGII